MLSEDGRYNGLLYRALNPVYARDPLSGEGARRYGGRFNPKGMAALYAALDPATALREANQVGDLQPTTLVAYRADLGPIFDSRQGAMTYGLDAEGLADPGWRAAMLDGRAVPTQELARALVADGYAGMLVPSYVQGAAAGAVNMVLWRWDGLKVVDDEGRLS